MISHEAALDFVTQPSHGCSTEDDHRWLCEQIQFAEGQGRLSQRWFRLQATLQNRVRKFSLYSVFITMETGVFSRQMLMKLS